MGTSIAGLYHGTKGSCEPKNGKNYNTAHSKDVKRVDSIGITDSHKMPLRGEPNSVVQKIIGGKLLEERYFDSNGKPYLDIDYSDHGNPKAHPVPHQHRIRVVDDKIIRGKQEEIRK